MNEIALYGTVGDSFWDEDYFTPKSVRALLEGLSGPLTVRLNSGGGIASDGQAIYTMLKDYPGEVEVIIDGVAASAASLIAMAADKITMRLGSWMLIHDPAMMFAEGRGTADDHRETAAFLDKIGDAYAEVYANRAGMSVEAARTIMRAETVYLGLEAVEAGFATDFEGMEARPAATFDYRIYANAPRTAREASTNLGKSPSEMAVMAVIAGTDRVTKEAVMADEEKLAEAAAKAKAKAEADAAAEAAAQAQAEEEAAAEAAKAEEAEKAAAVEASKRAKPTMSVAQANKLHALGARLEIPTADVVRAIEASADFETALDAINAQWKDMGEVNSPMHGAPTARITRDEREVQRAGMTEALFAQMSRTAPASDMARPFMDMKLAEMAAVCGDYKGPMRTTADIERALMAGTHSTSDFPAIFSNALNKQLEARYAMAEPTYRAIARRVSFNDFRPHPQVRTGDFPDLQSIAEGGEIKFGTFSEKQESVAVQSYAVGVRLTRQMLINDDLNAIAQVIADQGRMVARKEDALFYAMLLSGTSSNGPTLLETGRQVFNTTDGTRAGTAGAISVTTLAAGRAAMRKRKSLDGADMEITPAVLLVGPDKELEAQQIVAPLQAQQTGNVNPFAGTLQVVTTAKLADNSWYLFASPNDVPNFVYGFLSGYEAPRMRMDDPFGYQGTALTIEHDFGVGAVDFRGGWRNAGA